MRAEFAVALVAVLALVFGTPARAGETSFTVDGVEVTLTANWPATLNHGWQPVRVRIANPTDSDRTLSLVFTGNAGGSTDLVQRGVRVAAGATTQFEVALPARPSTSNAYFATCTVGGDREFGNVGAEQACDSTERIVLFASRAGPSTVSAADWATRLSAESEPRAPAPTPPAFRFAGPVPVATAIPAVPDHVRVAGIAYAELSALNEAYTSLHALVLDVGEGELPPRGVLDAIEAWVRTGGVLAIGGRGAHAVIAKEPALRAWVEPRFLTREAEGYAEYACGMGLLLVLEGDGVLVSAEQVAALNAALETLAPLDNEPLRSAFYLQIPGIEMPFRSLTLILILFAILVGPVNLIFVRRSKKPALLLLTIPAISILFSVGLVAFGIVAQGLDVRATSDSIGVLDQRAHVGSSHERRQMFVGLAAGPGLQPGPGAVVQRPLGDASDWRARNEYRVSVGESMTLAGSWLPVRTPTKISITTDRAARGRIDVEHGADGWKIVNGLDVTVKQLLFRDSAGELHAFEGPIVAGRSALAEPNGADGDALAAFEKERVLARHVQDGGPLPRGSWIARVDGSPLLDPCGLEYEEQVSDHVILGVVELAEGR